MVLLIALCSLLPALLFSQWLETTIQVGSAPCAFVWNSIENRTYVANYGSSTISVIQNVTGIEKYFIPDVKPFTPEIYPNPTNSFFVIRSPLPVKEIKIFDVSGKLIREITLMGTGQEIKIPLKGIKPGIYFLQLGKETKKFIVAKYMQVFCKADPPQADFLLHSLRILLDKFFWVSILNARCQ